MRAEPYPLIGDVVADKALVEQLAWRVDQSGLGLTLRAGAPGRSGLGLGPLEERTEHAKGRRSARSCAATGAGRERVKSSQPQ